MPFTLRQRRLSHSHHEKSNKSGRKLQWSLLRDETQYTCPEARGSARTNLKAGGSAQYTIDFR